MSASIKRLPLWFRYLVAAVVGAVIVVAFVLFVTHHQQPLSESAAPISKEQQAVQTREDRQLARQEQAPHTSSIGAPKPPTAAARLAIADYLFTQEQIGPLDSLKCSAVGQSSGRDAFRCDAVAGDRSSDQSMRYPFDVVVDSRARTVTYCQVITPPYPLKPLPVSAACR